MRQQTTEFETRYDKYLKYIDLELLVTNGQSPV